MKLLKSLIRKIPIKFQLFLGDVLGVLWFDVLRIRRDVALENLTFCFPEMSLDEKIRIGRASTRNLGRSFIEICRIPFLEPEDAKCFTIKGKEYLDRALAEEHGVFLLTQHIGNGDWATVGLSLNGIKLHVITKRLKLRWANSLWFKLRRKMGTELIEDRNTSFAILRALKNNAVIAYMLDQFMGPPIGVKTQFFGRETGTPMGLAVLAERSKAQVVPVVTYREPSGHTVIEFSEAIPYVQSQSKAETIQSMTQVYCDKIEKYVRQFPDQWMWVHRRWKPFRE